MKLQQAALMGALVVLTSLACGEERIVNGFATYGSGKLQGFVTSTDGSPVADVAVGASFGPVGQGLADTLVPVRFAPPGHAAVPVTVNLIVPAP